MITRLAPRPGDLDGDGADDWSVLSDRLTAIGSFFRLRHEDERLYDPPFTPEQVQALRAGKMPAGVL